MMGCLARLLPSWRAPMPATSACCHGGHCKGCEQQLYAASDRLVTCWLHLLTTLLTILCSLSPPLQVDPVQDQRLAEFVVGNHARSHPNQADAMEEEGPAGDGWVAGLDSTTPPFHHPAHMHAMPCHAIQSCLLLCPCLAPAQPPSHSTPVPASTPLLLTHLTPLHPLAPTAKTRTS